MVTLAPAAAFAQLDCVVPTQERAPVRGLSLRGPGLAPIRQAALAVEAIVRRNATGGDAELEAFEAPKLVGQVAGFPIYKDATGTTVMLSRTKAAPWIPVTIAEALDVEARRLDESYREWLREKARPRITETKVQRCYDTMKTVDGSRAEEACGPIRRACRMSRHSATSRGLTLMPSSLPKART